ncbi:hypothetical protein AtEden1_Chr00c002g0322701 [Arabidopsis thaliana]
MSTSFTMIGGEGPNSTGNIRNTRVPKKSKTVTRRCGTKTYMLWIFERGSKLVSWAIQIDVGSFLTARAQSSCPVDCYCFLDHVVPNGVQMFETVEGMMIISIGSSLMNC